MKANDKEASVNRKIIFENEENSSECQQWMALYLNHYSHFVEAGNDNLKLSPDLKYFIKNN